MKIFNITVLLITLLGAMNVQARAPMVDGISDEMIATVAGQKQVVEIQGPSDLDQTQAVIIKPENDTEAAQLMIIGSKGAHSFVLANNSNLDLIIEDEATLGSASSIKSNARGSLVIKLQNSGIGRYRYETEIFISYRGGQYILSGFTHSHYDTVDPKNSGSCDYNLLTGKGSKNSRLVAVKKTKTTFQALKSTQKLYSCDGW